MRHRLVLFDGVPGSGKTTTSRAVAEALERSDKPCGWAEEVDKTHPFFGPSLKQQHRQPEFGALCLEQWHAVTRGCNDRSWVLESCALQSTVRFMFERNWSTEAIDNYWRRFADIVAQANAALVYFRHRDVEQFIRGHTMHVRADVWAKISRHVESTPAGQRLAEEGYDVAVDFWVRYAELCDALVDEVPIPVLDIDLGAEDAWGRVTADVVKRLELPVAASR